MFVGHQTPQSSIMTGWRVTGEYHNATKGTTSAARISVALPVYILAWIKVHFVGVLDGLTVSSPVI